MAKKKPARYQVRRWPQIIHKRLAYFVVREPDAAICVCSNWQDAANVRDALNRIVKVEG